MFHVVEEFRITSGAGELNSNSTYGNNGAFFIRSVKLNNPLRAIASDSGGWEHVSVSLPNRCPRWEEMQFVKDLFWDDEDCVIQFHPPKSTYKNCHPHTLHMWRPIGIELPRPPTIMV